MKLQINEAQLKAVGQVGLRIGKSIVVEGTKAVLLKGAAVAINTSFEKGIDGVKDLKLDDLLKDKKDESKPKKEKMSLFRRKKKEVEIVDVDELIKDAVDKGKVVDVTLVED